MCVVSGGAENSHGMTESIFTKATSKMKGELNTQGLQLGRSFEFIPGLFDGVARLIRRLVVKVLRAKTTL